MGSRWRLFRTPNDPLFGFSESFGTQLSEPLVPEAEYILTAYLRQALRPDINYPGGYQIFLSASSSSSRFLVGALDPTTGQNSWEKRSISFLSPVNASDLQYITFVPYSSSQIPNTGSYPGLDALSLTRVPGPLPILGAAAAFGYSRKLRKRIKDSETLPVASAID